jgi:hypothetical protein
MFKKITTLWLIILGLLILPSFTLAANPCPPGTPLAECQTGVLTQIGTNSGYGPGGEQGVENISYRLGELISYVLGFLGVVFLVLVVVSGIQWMTAGGNEEKVTKARNRLINASIGLAIIVSAYAISWFVVYKLTVPSCPATCTPDSGSCSGQTMDPSTCPAGSYCCIAAPDDCMAAGFQCTAACTDPTKAHPELTCYGPAQGNNCCDEPI